MPRAQARRPRGTGSIRKHGSQWEIRWRERGRPMSLCFPDYKTAARALLKATGDAAAAKGGLEPDTSKSPALSILADEWLKHRANRSARHDRQRWRDHVAPVLGHMRPDEVDEGAIRRMVDRAIAGGLSSTTARLLVRLLSTFYTHLVEQRWAARNPVRTLPRQTRAAIRPAHDPKTTPFVERLEDVARVYRLLPDPVSVAYALGAFGGLRPGEILGLAWPHVDLDRGRIHVRQQRQGSKILPLKDSDSRIVPILDTLAPVLRAHRLRNPGSGLVLVTRYASRDRTAPLGVHQFGRELRVALGAAGLPQIDWYQATRHTFASHWVMSGGSMERLSAILGHSSVTTTERYAHLRPELFTGDEARLTVDLGVPGKVVSLWDGCGQEKSVSRKAE